MKLGKCLWSEDECAPDRELIDAAWPRLTGLAMPIVLSDGCTDYEDLGDTFHYLMPNGLIIQLAYDGFSIWEERP